MTPDAFWADARARFGFNQSISLIARCLNCSRWAVYSAIRCDVPPSQRARLIRRTRKSASIQERRRTVRRLAKQTCRVVGSRTVKQRGRPRNDGRARPTHVVTRTLTKLRFPSPASIARQLQLGHNIKASPTTVRRDLLAMGFKAVVRPYACALSPVEVAVRLAFCKRMLRGRVAQWDKFIFSDEKWFDANDSGVIHQWVQGRDARRQVIMRERVQAPAKVLVWGAITVGWRCLVVVVVDPQTGGLNGELYKQQCLAHLRTKDLVDRKLMQDGARIHWTPANRKYIERTLGVPVLQGWPAHSADLNPIEHMWSIVQRSVSQRGPWGDEDLKKLVVEEFMSVSDEAVERLVRSFKSRCQECVEACGAQVV